VRESNKDDDLTPNQRLQAHVAFAFSMAAGGDVSQIVLQTPNAVAQLVIDPLFRRGVLLLKGGIRGNVLGHFFSPKDFFRKQIKAGEN
jgi:hypothetical protein